MHKSLVAKHDVGILKAQGKEILVFQRGKGIPSSLDWSSATLGLGWLIKTNVSPHFYEEWLWIMLI